MLHRYSLGEEGERLEFEAVAITYYDESISIKGIIAASSRNVILSR
jgi:hypothetical protein